MKRTLLAFLLASPFFFCSALKAQNEWPKEIPSSDGGKVTMYEPQPESFSGNKLKGRAAVSVRKSDNDEPVFGAIFFTAIMSTDKDNRMAELESLTVTNAKFSGLEDQQEVDRLVSLIQRDAPDWNLHLSIDDIVASIRQDNPAAAKDQFNNRAPNFVYTNRPTTLVVLDGAPRVENDKNLNADKVVNSPNLIFREGNQWNLYAGGIWYRSNYITSGWRSNNNLSSKVRTIDAQIKQQEKENNDGKAAAASPRVTEILVTTEPTELLQTDGEPAFKTVQGTSLLYVSNSPNEIFKDINSQKTYVLTAGRWYNAPTMKGPWTFVPSDRLPEDFAKIPEGSEKDGVLPNVAGTEAAEEARIDAEIPQTAKVDRRTATVHVEYDGRPEFHSIEGTSLQLAENANLTVMLDGSGRYFALDNGVWFVADDPEGPWIVANERPREVENIPPTSPAYNSKYVYVYDETPDYVYCGYTAGYLGSYIYGPTIVYGTGYHYRPWYRTVYYPRPITWGFGFLYNPWYGWSMNCGYNFGFLYVGFRFGPSYHYYGGGWFGPTRYRPPYRPPYWGGGYFGRSNAGYRPAYYGASRPDRPSAGGRPLYGARPGSGWVNTNNLYNNHRGVITRDIDRRVMTTPSAVNERRLAGSDNRMLRNYDRQPASRDIGAPQQGSGDRNRMNDNSRVYAPGNGNSGNRSDANPSNRYPDNRVANPDGDRYNRNPGSRYSTGDDRPEDNNRTRNENVLTDRDGNIYRRDQQNNGWQTRDNRNRDWRPMTNDNPGRSNELERQQRSRERAETRDYNFERSAPVINRPSPAGRPAIMSQPPMAPSRSAPAPSMNRGGGNFGGGNMGGGSHSVGGGGGGGRPSRR